VIEVEDDDSVSESDEEQYEVDEIMEREHQLSRNNEMPSPYDMAVELQRYGFYIIDYVRIILDAHYQAEYGGILADYNSRHNLESLRTAISALMRHYREEGRIEREMDIWRNQNNQ
jgi:hypothetical protein